MIINIYNSCRGPSGQLHTEHNACLCYSTLQMPGKCLAAWQMPGCLYARKRKNVLH